jgi:WD40 repeat protein
MTPSHPMRLNWRRDTGSGFVCAVAFSPDSRFLAAGLGYPHTAVIFDTASGRVVRRLSAHSDTVIKVAFTPHGDQVMTVSADGWLRQWAVHDGTLLSNVYLADQLYLGGCAVSSDVLACIAGNATAQVRDSRTGEVLHALDCGEHRLTALALDHSGACVAVAGDSGFLGLWRPEGRDGLLRLKAHDNAIQVVAFDGTGRLLASSDIHPRVCIWDTMHARQPELLDLPQEQRGSISAIAFQPGGALLALGTFRGEHQILVWDRTTGSLTQMLDDADDIVNEVAFSADGRWLAAAADDRGVTVAVWAMN